MSIKIYGIPNCDTVKKARKWLEANTLEYEFHDFKKQGLTEEKLKHWFDVLGKERVVNTRGTTWRKLPEEAKSLEDEGALIVLALENLSIIKRPVLEKESNLLIGYDESAYHSLLLA